MDREEPLNARERQVQREMWAREEKELHNRDFLAADYGEAPKGADW